MLTDIRKYERRFQTCVNFQIRLNKTCKHKNHKQQLWGIKNISPIKAEPRPHGFLKRIKMLEKNIYQTYRNYFMKEKTKDYIQTHPFNVTLILKPNNHNEQRKHKLHSLVNIQMKIVHERKLFLLDTSHPFQEQITEPFIHNQNSLMQNKRTVCNNENEQQHSL